MSSGNNEEPGNLGYLYYKEYYKDIFEKNKDLKKRGNDVLEKSDIKRLESINEIKDYEGIRKFYLKTTYPGLLVGSGYNHEIDKENNQFKLGFEFDYTTGLPIINGSSIKGLLRSAFCNDDDSLIEEKRSYIKEVMKDLKIPYNDSDFKKITEEIFEGKSEGQNISMYDRDIFFDAIIDKEETEKLMKEYKNKEEFRILGEDYITKHGDNEQNIEEPNPIRFLKVMPNVVWCFQFALKDEYFAGKEKEYAESKKKAYTINAKKRCELFKRIIIDLGLGAKTNAGYGVFKELDENMIKYHN